MDSLPDSIAGLHQLYRSGVTPTEVVTAVLARLDRWEPQLNAFISVLADEAYAQAREAESRFSAGGPLLALDGVPVSVKDVVAIAGRPRTAGSRILRERPDHDAVVYGRLRRAGAIVFATTNMLEFAYGFAHPDRGRSNNPWDTARTAGGSSGGSAASVAAGIGYGSIVTDTGGSARLPAAFCGVAGLKPTFGAIDVAGVLGLAPSLDVVGLLTRGVDDLRLLYEVTTDEVTRRGRDVEESQVTVGVIDDLLGEPLDAEVATAFVAALDAVRLAGARVREVRLPGVLADAEQVATIMLAEASHSHRPWYPRRAADYAPGTATNLAAGHAVSAVDYLGALETRDRLRGRVDELLSDVDVLACPTIGFTAPADEPDFKGGGRGYVARTIPFSATGHPALSVPAPSAGLPVGIELVAARHHEGDLLDLAARYERALDGFARPGELVQ